MTDRLKVLTQQPTIVVLVSSLARAISGIQSVQNPPCRVPSLRLRRPSFETDEGDEVHAGKRVASVIHGLSMGSG